MLLLSEIEGPPRHLQALLKCVSRVPDKLAVKVTHDLEMTYLQYVHGVLGIVSLCGPHLRLAICLPARYTLDHHTNLDQGDMESLATIPLPEVASLEILFPSISEKKLLVCFPLREVSNKLISVLSGLLHTVVLPYANAAPYSSICAFS
jgi:hypothetical protein